MSEFSDAEAGIRQLYSRYTDAVWRKDAEAFGQCFSPEAQWRISGMIFRGREEIEEAIRRILANAHRILITFQTPILALTDEGANGRTYVTEQCSWTHREPNVSIGRYYDRFVDDGERWRFSWRIFQLHYSGPADLSGTWHEHPDYGPPPGMPDDDALTADHASGKWGLDPENPLG